MEEHEFESILTGAREGAEWAWERIYTHYAGRVRAYVRRQGATDPDDVVGEVFLQLARHMATFEGSADNFSSWVFTVAHHRVIDERRRRSRRPAVPMAEIDEPQPTNPDATARDALDAVATDRIQALLDRLSPDQREVLLLRILGGFTIPEIADVVGKRVGAVKALQRRGLARLQALLDAEGVPL